jgi:hypothetical protein
VKVLPAVRHRRNKCNPEASSPVAKEVRQRRRLIILLRLQLRVSQRKGIHDWRTRLVRIVDAGIKAGEIHKSTDSRRIANTLIATLEGALMISRLDNSRQALRDAQATLDTILTGIATSRR